MEFGERFVCFTKFYYAMFNLTNLVFRDVGGFLEIRFYEWFMRRRVCVGFREWFMRRRVCVGFCKWFMRKKSLCYVAAIHGLVFTAHHQIMLKSYLTCYFFRN